MDDLLVENIDDDLLWKIEDNARRNGQTVDEEAIYLLELSLSKELKSSQPQNADFKSAKSRTE